MNILVIDDDILFSKYFIKDISNFLHNYNSDLKIKVYNTNFLNINYEANYRIAFIDIDLKIINGIKLSKLIKQSNPNCDIVFISAKNNLIHSSLSVQPFFFIRKSDYFEDLYVFFELIKESLSNKHFIQLSYKLTKTTLSIQDIIYVESHQHILNIYTIFGNYKDGRTLKEFSALLPSNQFLQIHRAFFINCKYVYSISNNIVILHKKSNPTKQDIIKLRVSRSYQKNFEKQYQEYLLL